MRRTSQRIAAYERCFTSNAAALTWFLGILAQCGPTESLTLHQVLRFMLSSCQLKRMACCQRPRPCNGHQQVLARLGSGKRSPTLAVCQPRDLVGMLKRSHDLSRKTHRDGKVKCLPKGLTTCDLHNLGTDFLGRREDDQTAKYLGIGLWMPVSEYRRPINLAVRLGPAVHGYFANEKPVGCMQTPNSAKSWSTKASTTASEQALGTFNRDVPAHQAASLSQQPRSGNPRISDQPA